MHHALFNKDKSAFKILHCGFFSYRKKHKRNTIYLFDLWSKYNYSLSFVFLLLRQQQENILHMLSAEQSGLEVPLIPVGTATTSTTAATSAVETSISGTAVTVSTAGTTSTTAATSAVETSISGTAVTVSTAGTTSTTAATSAIETSVSGTAVTVSTAGTTSTTATARTVSQAGELNVTPGTPGQWVGDMIQVRKQNVILIVPQNNVIPF